MIRNQLKDASIMTNENAKPSMGPAGTGEKKPNAGLAANAKTQLLRRAGTSVWAPSPSEAWATGTVVADSSTDKIQVKLSSGETVEVLTDQIELNTMNSQQAAKVEDLTKLPNLHEPGLLLTLHERFKVNEIYTYTGPILLAVNPFKRLPNLYSDKLLKTYLDADVGDNLPPHAWRIADRAFKSMAEDSGKNQSILVSGESGAGKTETTKIVMRYLTVVSHSSSSSNDPSHAVSDRVLQLNPLVEAFGNAKTSRNDNSSRFGKLIQLKFDPLSGKLTGAYVDTYLLEKARVVTQATGERNYHIFYELAAGATQEEKSRWKFTDLKDFRYTNQSGCSTRNDVADAEQFKDTLKAMDIVGLTSSERDFVFSTVMSVLHLGNITFEPAKKNVERKGVVSTEDGSVPNRTGTSGKALESCASLLNVDINALAEALTTKKVNVGFGANTFASGLTNALGLSETFLKHFTPQQASEARDALAMTVYDRLFSWIVWRVNEAISNAAKGGDGPQTETLGVGGGRAATSQARRTSALTTASLAGRTRAPTDANAGGGRGRAPTFQSEMGGGMGMGRPRAPTLQEQERLDPTDRSFLYDFTIGCLDIFGFEVFQKNSFEQLCINYANENLQQQFNEFVFELEQKVYQGEGIDWAYVSFPDNKPTLEMIEARPIGLLSLIDEECLYPQGDDKTLASKLYNNLPKKFPRFSADQKDRINRKFVVHHFAGDVKYDVDGMYAKNKNELHQELVDVVRSSKRKELASLMPADASQAALGVTKKPAGESSLNTHAEELKKADDRHAKKTGGQAGGSRIQQKTVGAVFKQQLTLAMAHIRASQPHYVRCLKPNDLNKPDILNRTRTVEQLRYSGVLEVVKVARAGYPTRFRVLEFVKRYYPLLGTTGEAMPPPGPALAAMTPADHKKMAERIVTTAQLVFGEDYQIGKTKVFLRPATFTRLEIIKSDRLKMHVVKIQKVARGYIVRRKYVNRRKAATKIQAFFRGYRERKKVFKWRQQRKAAKMIQKHVRGYLVRLKYDPIFNKRADAAWVIHRAMRRKIMQVRLKVIRERGVQERAAVMLQGLARIIKAQKVANSLYVNKVTDMAATSIQGLAKIIQAKKERKLLEKKRIEEQPPPGAQFIWWVGPLIIVFLLANPLILVALCIVFVSMAVGGGFVLDQQRRTEITERRMRYARMRMADLTGEDVLYLGGDRKSTGSVAKSRPSANGSGGGVVKKPNKPSNGGRGSNLRKI